MNQICFFFVSPRKSVTHTPRHTRKTHFSWNEVIVCVQVWTQNAHLVNSSMSFFFDAKKQATKIPMQQK